MNTLIIRHLPDSDPPRFQVSRSLDQKAAEPVEVLSPVGWPVEGRPDSDLVRQMPWYLEEFLEYPFPPSTDQAKLVLESLEAWGSTAFKTLFDSGRARDFFHDATRQGHENLDLHVISDDSRILQWPWEASRS